MPSEEVHSGVAAGKLADREQAAHEKRNWVRLNYQCNDRCVFCLDAHTHDGTDRDRAEVKADILEGRRRGATRLVLSGGEPTIHPDFAGFVALGRRAGYTRVQTISNGRMFSYPEFLGRCLDAGLGEITFSIHGPNARIHDALVGTKGAFDQAVTGLRNALADGRPIVNVDIVVNRANVEHLADMLDRFYGWGVREFDLLQLVPFGRAFAEGRARLFYDLEAAGPALQRAFAFADRPDVHLWLNRFPPEHLEGHEHLIQDPHKLFDEVRGRKRELALFLDRGVDLDCRAPERCRHCYLERFCDHLYATRQMLADGAFDAVRVAALEPEVAEASLGGDPASDRRAQAAEPEADTPAVAVTTAELVRAAKQRGLVVRAPHLRAALELVRAHPDARSVELELADCAGLADALDDSGALGGIQLARVTTRTSRQAEELLAITGDFEVAVLLGKATATWLLALGAAPRRLVIRQPTHERLDAARAGDVDIGAFFARLGVAIPAQGVPPCVAAGTRPRWRVLDTAALSPRGHLEIFRFTRQFIRSWYRVKSRRCAGCAHGPDCAGSHVNYIRARGFRHMRPVDDG